MAIRVIHVPYTYAPDPAGGTENYVHDLAQALRSRGVESHIAAPGAASRSYRHDGLDVRRFGIAQRPLALAELYGAGDPVAAENFAPLLDEVAPQLLHLHAFTPAVSTRVVRAARARAVPVIFTYHTPTVSCQRGTLLEWGLQDCDGALAVRRCTQCALHGAGAPRLAARAAAQVPPGLGAGLARLNLSGGLWTALRMTDLMRQRHEATREFLDLVSHIVVPARWAQDVLVANGVPPEKITYSPQGLAPHANPAAAVEAPRRLCEGALRIAYLGRLNPVKGAHLLVSAVTQSPALNVEIDVYGIVQAGADEPYAQRLKDAAAGDPRIRFHAAVPPREVIGLIRRHDAVAIPSQFTETGPLVALEAFAAGVPVIGSGVRGIREHVRHNVNGVVVTPNTPDGWAAALGALSRERLAELGKGIQPPRSMEPVADEIAAVYRRVLGFLQ